jgi:DNA repair protein RecO (recombination protein O)
MPRVKDTAFIINKVGFGESDLILTLFTAGRGKVSAIGKGAKRSRKRFPGSLELFSRVSFSGFIKHPLALTRIDECRLIEPYVSIQEELRSYYCACYFLEIINRCCAERQANRAIFVLLDEILTYLSSKPTNRNFNCRIRLFELQIIALLGFKPRLDQCLECRGRLDQDRFFTFSPEAGGLVCGSCKKHYTAAFTVSRGTVNLLNLASRLDSDLKNKLNFTPQVERESARLCRALLRWHSGCEFKSLKVLENHTAFSRNDTIAMKADLRLERWEENR